MLAQTRKFFVLFSAVAILLTGHGLQLTLLPLRAEALGWSLPEIGLSGSFYFLGFLVGCIGVPRFVTRVGHIRTFSTTTTLCGAALLMILLSDLPQVWYALRFLTGIGISGCYLIIESWLNEQSSDADRGRTMAIYTIIVLLAMSIGQFLVTVAPPLSLTTVVLGSLLLSLAVTPVSLSPVDAPAAITRLEWNFMKIFRAAPAAVGGAMTMGTVTAVLFTLTPVYASQIELPLDLVALLMVAMLLGGAALQYPAGHISDRLDRRHVMIGLLALGIACCAAAYAAPRIPALEIAIMFLLGGVCTAIYPLSLAHANDRLPGHFLAVGTVILLVNSGGATSGRRWARWSWSCSARAAYSSTSGPACCSPWPG